MKILQITNNLDFYFNKRLKSLIEASGHEHHFLQANDFTLNLSHNSLKDMDVIFHRVSSVHQDSIHLSMLSGFESKVVNSLSAIHKCHSKTAQITRLHSLGIKTPKSFAIRGSHFNQITDLLKQEAGPPYILKPEIGMQGIGVNLVENEQQLLSWLETFYYQKDQRWLVQEFIQADEYRAVVVGNKIEGILKRVSDKKSFKANYHQGSHAEIASLSQPHRSAVQETISKITQNFGLDYCAVDFFIKNDQVIVVDINAHPGFKQAEQVLKLDIIGSVLELAMAKLAK